MVTIMQLGRFRVIEPPHLLQNLDCSQPYRNAQRLRVAVKQPGAPDDEPAAGEDVDIINCNSPASRKHPLHAAVRKNVLRSLHDACGCRYIIGGDLNTGEIGLRANLTAVAKDDHPDLIFARKVGRLQGDVAIVAGLDVEHEESTVGKSFDGSSDAHDLVVVSASPQAGAYAQDTRAQKAPSRAVVIRPSTAWRTDADRKRRKILREMKEATDDVEMKEATDDVYK